MPVTTISRKGSGILVMNDLSLGKAQMSARTDNTLAVKLNKLKWAMAKAEADGGVLLLTGKIFDKTSSFNDLAFIFQQGVLNNPSLYLMADHLSYQVSEGIAQKTMMGVINSIYPEKIVFDRPLQIAGNLYVSPRVMWQAYAESNAVDGCFFLFDNNKRARSLVGQERGCTILATNKTVPGAGINPNIVKIRPSFRTSVSDSYPCVYWLTQDGNINVIDIPHEASVFSDEIEKGVIARDEIKESVELSISEAFDPRKSRISDDEDAFTIALEKEYNRSKLSKSAYDIITKMKDLYQAP